MKRLLPLALFAAFFLLVTPARAGEDDDVIQQCYVVGKSRKLVTGLLEKVQQNWCYEDFFLTYLPEFEGVPYGGGAAGAPANKTLVNTQQMDCVTFVENFLAMAIAAEETRRKKDQFSANQLFARYVQHLNRVRYYGGKPGSWENRIHYFTDAMRLLTEKDVLEDVGRYNGVPFTKQINYISSNRHKFNFSDWNRVLNIEREMSNADRYYYPLDSLHRYAPIARNGDIVALTTTVEGLDVSHCGYITVKNDRLMFSHASSVHKKIVLEVDFEDYLDTRTTITGIMVFRPSFS